MGGAGNDAAGDFPHLLPAVRPIIGRSKEERIRFAFEDRWIEYAVARQAIEAIRKLAEQPKQLRMRGILVAGRPDNGKSALLRRFRQLQPYRVREDGGAELPVVLMSMPDQPTEAKFWSNMLRAMKIPHASSDSARYLRQQAMHVVEAQGSRLLMIDELHNIMRGSALQQRHALVMLKGISNELSIATVLAGTKDAVATLQTDTQLTTRFRLVPLPPWREGEEARRLLAGLESVMPLAKPSDLASKPMVQALLELSNQTIGGMVYALKEATELAIETGQECIDERLLKRIKRPTLVGYDRIEDVI